MNIQFLAHRGLWREAQEQNTLQALEAAFEQGFGIETDLRDLGGKIVVAHDPATFERHSIELNELLRLYKKYDCKLPLALNVKADGLQKETINLLEKYQVDLSQIFFFDMSVPDALGYLKHKLPCYTRYSEYELHPSFLDEANGVWVDSFKGVDRQIDAAVCYLQQGLNIALVSPELHKRVYKDVWKSWKQQLEEVVNCRGNVYICTDYPNEAKSFFYE